MNKPSRRAERFTPPKPTSRPAHLVTDHALLRYMERVLGLDIEGFRAKVIPQDAQKVVATMKDGRIPIGDGHTAKVVNGVVVTIV